MNMADIDNDDLIDERRPLSALTFTHLDGGIITHAFTIRDISRSFCVFLETMNERYKAIASMPVQK